MMRPMNAASTKYRPDIDGLRAFAVVPVVLYHAGIPHFSGGYVGVDVFFVISGYLITSLIITEVDAGRFSLLHFYERRMRRIFPALFFVMACCAAFGWFVLAPNDFTQLGTSIFATSIFLSNVLFWRQSGYFDTSAAEKPLLHTWSLAVEEQFYVFFPLYLLLIAKWFPRHRLLVTAVLCALSLLLSAIAVYYKPWATFYLAPTRAWELLLGALLAIGAVAPIQTMPYRNAAFAIGVTLITAAVLGYTKETIFPGAAALLPTAGAALVIWAGARATTLADHTLATGPAVFAGKISYSIYLWHYPLFAFAGYLSIDKLSPVSTFYLVIALPLLAIVSWRFVEQPFRKVTSAPRKSGRAVAVGLVTILAFAGFGLMIPLYNGFGSRMSPGVFHKLAEEDDTDPDRETCLDSLATNLSRESLCKIGVSANGAPTFLLWGDSHAEALRPALDVVAKKRALSGYFVGWLDCAPLSGVRNLKEKKCDEGNEAVFRFLAEDRSIKTVILAARWSWSAEGRRYKSEDAEDRQLLILPGESEANHLNNHEAFAYGLEQTISRLVKLEKTVWIVGPIPEVGYRVPKALYLQSLGLYANAPIEPTTDEFYQRQDFVLSVFHDLATRYPLHFIWPHEAFCHEHVCEVQRDGMPLYSDNNHLSVYGARSIWQIFYESLTRNELSGFSPL